jgi:hypothetical protein
MQCQSVSCSVAFVCSSLRRDIPCYLNGRFSWPRVGKGSSTVSSCLAVDRDFSAITLLHRSVGLLFRVVNKWRKFRLDWRLDRLYNTIPNILSSSRTCGLKGRWSRAGIAQLVEYKLPKLGVAGSNPVARSIFRPFRPASLFEVVSPVQEK